MSRIITPTRTGSIITDTDLGIEYLYVGDYGKENNIKASFLGFDKRIEKVEQPLVAAGWDVIVFIPSAEEDEDRITCGNALLANMKGEN